MTCIPQNIRSMFGLQPMVNEGRLTSYIHIVIKCQILIGTNKQTNSMVQWSSGTILASGTARITISKL